MNSSLRILYAAGPGNVIGTYHYWLKEQDDPSQVSITYSSQFYTVCQELDAQGYVIASNSKQQLLKDDRFTIEHRPIPLSHSSGILYHLGYLWYGLGIILTAVRFKANVAVVANGTTHWFLLSILPLMGIQVIPSLHCVLWRKNQPKTKKENFLLSLDKNFFKNKCLAILSVSNDINKNIEDLTDGKHSPIFNFLPIYRQSEFTNVGEPCKNFTSFRVLFVGRIEKNKGVFDLLEIAKDFFQEGKHDIYFDLCGDGTALDSLRLDAQKAEVDSMFICHGHCNKVKMREMFSQSDLVIVPTTSDFIEGFNKVVVEAVLVGRPIITSSVCPALSYVQGAAVEAKPDDIDSYRDAILKLYTDRELYKEKQKNCLELQEKFYDLSNGWGNQLKSILLEYFNS